MRFSVDRLVKAISERRSTRNFTGHPISAEILEALAHTKDLQPLGLASCRTVLLYDPAGFDTVFTGIVGSYGKIRGATAILVLVVPASSGDEGKLEAGFIGEQYVLLATALGVATCWVAGMYHHKTLATHLSLTPDEVIQSIIALGYAESKRDALGILLHTFVRRKKLAEIASPLLLNGPPWLKTALEAVRLAPSAVNLQPWHFDGTPQRVALRATRRAAFTAIDLGIAMAHFALAAENSGMRGAWQQEGNTLVFLPAENPR
ncbi:MAG: hypothetical protein DDT37_01600 [Firmicutes bacterium]|nr:hypothetical protein [candidate division NPL-UPA2 bacterium]MBT9156612.1 hypothetical protein [candidate division NPL-UPA2 bacterium]